MEVPSGPFVSGAYHRRRVSPDPARRRPRRARRGRPRPAHLRLQLPGRAAACRRRRRSASPRPAPWPADGRATSGSRAGSMPRTSSRTTRTARSSSAGPASSSRRTAAGSRSRTAASGSGSRSATASTGSSWTTPPSTPASSSCRANRSARPPTSPTASRPAPPPTTPVRLRVDQVSSVEHAIVLGVPRLDADGEPRLSAGLGRPLVLTTLETDEAMRVLAEGRSGRIKVALVCLAGGVGLVVIALVARARGRDRVRRCRCGAVASSRRVVARLAGLRRCRRSPRRRPRPRRSATRAAPGRGRGWSAIRASPLLAVDRDRSSARWSSTLVYVRLTAGRERLSPAVGPSDYWQEL